MSEKFDNRLIINIKDSPILTGVLLTIHLGGMLLVVLVSLPWWLRIGLAGALAASMAISLGRHGWRRASRAITAFELDHEGIASIREGRDSNWRECTIRRAVIHPGIALLWLHVNGRRWPCSLVLAADAVEPEAFRRLRARLLLETRAA